MTWWVPLCLILCALALRLPYFLVDEIDWDESTFILVGQAMTDGDLPYTALWDNKPPLGFAIFAAVIAVFGKSIVAIRLLGLLAIVVTAGMVYLMARRTTSRGTALGGAVLFIALVSATHSGQSTMTETLAVVPLTFATMLLATRPQRPWPLMAVGLALGAATLIRTNLGLVPFGLAGYLAWSWWKGKENHGARQLAALSGGFLLPLLASFAPYLVTGRQEVWFRSVVLAPLAYVLGRTGFVAAIGVTRSRLIDTSGPSHWLQQLPVERQAEYAVLLASLGLVLLSIIIPGIATPHYWIQAYPVGSVLAALLYHHLAHTRLFVTPVVRKGSRLLFVVLPLALVPMLWAPYSALARHVEQHGWTVQGDAIEVARYLRAHNPDREPVYLLTAHLAYWFLDQRPLTKATTHPSNLVDAPLMSVAQGFPTSPLAELERVLAQRPLYIVKPDRVWYLQGAPAVAAALDHALATHYVLETTVARQKMYRRSR